jgi:hypothetical protein
MKAKETRLPPSLHRLVMERRTPQSKHSAGGQNVESKFSGSKLSQTMPVSGVPQPRQRPRTVLQREVQDGRLESAPRAE